MTKVKLPQPVADKLDQLRDFGYSKESIVACRTDSSSNYAILRTIPFETFLQAVLNGYECDKTVDERHAELAALFVRKYYDVSNGVSHGFAMGIKQTLDILGITVAGINDNKTEVSTNEHE